MTKFSDCAWRDMHVSMWYARCEARLLFYEMFGEDLVITSGRRPVSPKNPRSLHAHGKAMDIRVRHLSIPDRVAFAERLQEVLGEDFHVILEGPGATDPRYAKSVPHVHVEYEPKGKHLTE